MKLAEARRRTELVRAVLSEHPGVNGVGVGEKVKGGINQKHYAAVVLVENKRKPLGPLIPPNIVTARGSIATDVVEAPLDSFEVANQTLDGGDVLINALQTEKGTLGLVATFGTENTFAISNAHVFAEPNENARGTAVFANLLGTRRRIGEVVAHSPYRTDRLNRHDVSLIQLDPDVTDHAAPIMYEGLKDKVTVAGRLNPSPQNGGRKEFFYVSKASGGLELVELKHVVEVTKFDATDKGRRLPFAVVYRLGVKRGEVKPGHSGAAIVRRFTNKDNKTGLKLVGLLFAGRGKTAYALSWNDVSDAIKSFGI